MKTEKEIREEIKRHKEAIKHNFNEMTQDEKIHKQIIQTLEWVIKDE